MTFTDYTLNSSHPSLFYQILLWPFSLFAHKSLVIHNKAVVFIANTTVEPNTNTGVNKEKLVMKTPIHTNTF